VTFARLVLKDLLSAPLRLSLTILSGAIGVFAFAFLQTTLRLFALSVEAAEADRLIVRSKTSIIQPLPLSYLPRIAAVPGVRLITHQNWFGARLGEATEQQFASFTVDSPTFLAVYPELLLPREQRAAFEEDPCGAIAGEDLARRYGWKVGGRVVLQGTIYPGDWEVNVRGIYRAERPGVDTTVLYLGYRCLNERLPRGEKNRVGVFALRIDDPSASNEIASAIDGMFANSPYETRTESERAFISGFLAMSSAIVTAIRTVSFVVLGILLLVVSNTLAMGVREKAVQLATLKALGFRSRAAVWMVIAQALIIGAAAAAAGLAAAPAIISAFVAAVEQQIGPMGPVGLDAATALLSVLAVSVVSLLAAAAPAIRVARLQVAEGLRRVGA
jgi:putative ABC transport system permease protein